MREAMATDYDHAKCGRCGRPRDEVGTPCVDCADVDDIHEVARLVELIATRRSTHPMIRAAWAMTASKRLMQVHDRAMAMVRVECECGPDTCD